jgi:hypothetical protein
LLDEDLPNSVPVTLPAHFSTMRQPALWALVVSLSIVVAMLLLGGWNEPTGKGFVFVALCFALVSGVSLIPGLSKLSVHEEGITLNTLLWRQHLRWENLQRFTLLDFDDTGIGLTPAWARFSIGYVVNEEQLKVTPRLYRKFHEFYGCHGSLPPVDKMPTTELLQMLNRALSASRQRSPEE